MISYYDNRGNFLEGYKLERIRVSLFHAQNVIHAPTCRKCSLANGFINLLFEFAKGAKALNHISVGF
jgi:hypothetical protein